MLAALLVLLLSAVCAALAIFFFMHGPAFGARPKGKRLERMRRSPNYGDGKFHNNADKPALAEGVGLTGITLKFLFGKKDHPAPPAPLPAVKTDLTALVRDGEDPSPVLVWFGHSSYLLRLDGKTVLVDPVFAERASPVPFTVTAFPGTRIYTARDMPRTDYLFLTHDHWDHLDYKAMLVLRERTDRVVCPLGVGAHLERWGFDPARVTECDWDETLPLGEGFTAHSVTAHHFSGRAAKRDVTLWTAYVLETPSARIYIGGDGGYGEHFAEQGRRFGPFDLAILEAGQYNPDWRYSHMHPEETLRAARDLGALRLFPAHNSKYIISNHPWDEPMARLGAKRFPDGPRMLFPLIGEPVRVLDDTRHFEKWWEKVGGSD